MKNREQILTHPSQLNALSVLPLLRTTGLGMLRLGGNIFEHPERKRWENQLNRYYYACGCDTGAAGLLITLLLGAGWAGYAYSQEMLGGGAAVGVAFLSALGGAIAGKLFGQVRANQRLKQIVSEIQGQWQVEDDPKEDWTCG